MPRRKKKSATIEQKNYEDLKEHVSFSPMMVSENDYFDVRRQVGVDETTIRLNGLESFYKMRGQWSIFLMLCLFIILAFNIVMVFLVGAGLIEFKDEWFLRIVLATNLADIIGLVYLVVRFLFSHPPIGAPVVNTSANSNPVQVTAPNQQEIPSL